MPLPGEGVPFSQREKGFVLYGFLHGEFFRV
jgi:hypothetical protein